MRGEEGCKLSVTWDCHPLGGKSAGEKAASLMRRRMAPAMLDCCEDRRVRCHAQLSSSTLSESLECSPDDPQRSCTSSRCSQTQPPTTEQLQKQPHCGERSSAPLA
jgi:hypothetical protein